MGGLLHLVQRGGDWAEPQPAQAPPRCTKCNSPTINGQCINIVLFDVELLLPLESKGLNWEEQLTFDHMICFWHVCFCLLLFWMKTAKTTEMSLTTTTESTTGLYCIIGYVLLLSSSLQLTIFCSPGFTWMDGWMDGWMDEWMNEWMNQSINQSIWLRVISLF